MTAHLFVSPAEACVVVNFNCASGSERDGFSSEIYNARLRSRIEHYRVDKSAGEGAGATNRRAASAG